MYVCILVVARVRRPEASPSSLLRASPRASARTSRGLPSHRPAWPPSGLITLYLRLLYSAAGGPRPLPPPFSVLRPALARGPRADYPRTAPPVFFVRWRFAHIYRFVQKKRGNACVIGFNQLPLALNELFAVFRRSFARLSPVAGRQQLYLLTINRIDKWQSFIHILSMGHQVPSD